jgi:hypothetical protein
MHASLAHLNVIQVCKDKGLGHVKPASDDIFSIFEGQSVALVQLQIGLEQELLVISQLDNKRTIECILQPLQNMKNYKDSYATY